MFAETFYIDEIISELHKLAKKTLPANRTSIRTIDDAQLLVECQGKLFNAQKQVFDAETRGCVNSDEPEEGSINTKGDKTTHVKYEVHMLQEPYPEIFLVNLSWKTGKGTP